MANSLDSTALVNIAKNRNRLLRLADGIRTRKKPGGNKKTMRLDPAYTNIEHLVFGTYRARSSTPDNRTHNIPDNDSATLRLNGLVRQTLHRSSDGSESERSSILSSTDPRCECNRHSPSLAPETEVRDYLLENLKQLPHSPNSTLLNKADLFVREEAAIALGIDTEGDAFTFSGSKLNSDALSNVSAGESALKVDGGYRVSEGFCKNCTVEPTVVETSLERETDVGMPGSVEPMRRGRSLGHRVQKEWSTNSSSTTKGSSPKHSQLRKTSIDEGVSEINRGRRTSWKELAESKNVESRCELKSLPTKDENDYKSSKETRDACNRLDQTINVNRTPLDRQYSFPSGIPKPKVLLSQRHSGGSINSSLSNPSSDCCQDVSKDNLKLTKPVRQQTPGIVKPVLDRSRVRRPGSFSLENHSSTSGVKEQEFLVYSESGSLTPENSDIRLTEDCGKATGVTCKIRITPPNNATGNSSIGILNNPSKVLNASGRSQSLSRNSSANRSTGGTKSPGNNVGKDKSTIFKPKVNGPKGILNKSVSSTTKNGRLKNLNGHDLDSNIIYNEGRPKPIQNHSILHGDSKPQSANHSPPPEVEKQIPKTIDFKEAINKLDRQTYGALKAVPSQIPELGGSHGKTRRWSDLNKKNDSEITFEPTSLSQINVCKMTNGTSQPVKTTWAQLGKSRSSDSTSKNSDDKHIPSSTSARQFRSIEYQPSISIQNESRNNKNDNSSKALNSEVDFQVPVNSLSRASSYSAIPNRSLSVITVSEQFSSYRHNQDGPMSLVLTCEEEPGGNVMNETSIESSRKTTSSESTEKKLNENISQKAFPESTNSIQQTTKLSSSDGIPVLSFIRKRSLSVGSTSRHSDLRLIAAFQRYDKTSKNLTENPEGCMSDIEEKEENSSSGASRATSEEPPDMFIDLECSNNKAAIRASSRRRTAGSLGLERLLPIGPIIVSGGPGAGPQVLQSLPLFKKNMNNVSVISCNANNQLLTDSQRKSTPESDLLLQNLESVEHREWEKSVTIETGSTNSHLVVGDEGSTSLIDSSDCVPAPTFQTQEIQNACHLSQAATPVSSLPPTSYRLMRNRPISRSERHLKTTSTSGIPVGDISDRNGGGSVRDIRRPWSEVYGDEAETQRILQATNCFSVPNFPHPGDSSVEGSFLNRLSSARATDSMLQKFRKTFSIRFQKTRKEGIVPTTITPIRVPVSPVPDLSLLAAPTEVVENPSPVITVENFSSLPASREGRFTLPSEINEGPFKMGLSVLRSSRDRKKGRKKDSRSSKCNSADSGIQVEGMCPSGDGVTESNSATESPALVRRRLASERKSHERPLSDYIDHNDLESVYELTTPPPIKLRTERTTRPKIPRQKARSRLRRSISQPVDLEKLGFSHKTIEYGLSDHEASREPSIASSEDFSSDNELYHSLRSPIRKQAILREVTNDSVTYAEALWDHVTIDSEELPFKAGQVIEVTDTSDKDWWWGAIATKNGWFPAPFVRLRVSQEDTVEDCMIRMADGTLTSRGHTSSKMSVSLLSNEQVRANIIREIYTTEKDFVQHLKDVVEGYLQQVRRRPDMFSEEHISTIFGNIEAIFRFQCIFLKNLEACVNWHSPHLSEIGHCFLQHKDSFKIYSEYCNNHPLAVSQLQELFVDKQYVHFFEACRLLQEMIDISLDGFLLTPVQKICKYPLQLAELLKYTKPDHPDFESVSAALSAMRGVAHLVNERKRRMECLEKLVELQRTVEGWEGPNILESSSLLVHSGEITRVTANWSRDITLFLFDHLLVYCKKDLLKRNTAVYKGSIELDSCCVFDVEDGRDAQFGINLRNAFKIHCSKRDKWFLFYAKTSQDKLRWLQALREERHQVEEDRIQGFTVTEQAKKAAKLAVFNKSKNKRPRAKIPKGTRRHPDTAIVELLLDNPGPKTRSGSLPSNLSPSVVVHGKTRVAPNKKKGSGWFHFGSGKKSKK